MRFEKYLPHYTVEDYNHWEGEWELIDGIPYAMSPSPTDWHQSLGSELITQINIELKAKKDNCGDCRVVYDLDWKLDNSTVLKPDVAVICNKREKFIPSPPVLIIEILSPSTALKDRNIKFEIYREQGVKYYIIADPVARSFSIFELVDNQFQQQDALKAFVIHEQCAISINVAAALASL